MAKPLASYDDPTLRRAAVVLVEEARAAVEAAILKGQPWHSARETFLYANAGRWVAEHGKNCADMAVRGVNAIAPDEWLSKDGRKVESDRWRRHWLDHIEKTGKATLLNRLWVRWFAVPLYGLAVVAGLSLAAPDPAEAASRRAALAACAEARSDAERHRRQCWRFNSVERNTYRSYDRADSPRDWERPRDWE
jgi:hypothetical protein